MICYKNINLKNILLVVLLFIIILVILFNDINELSYIKNLFTISNTIKYNLNSNINNKNLKTMEDDINLENTDANSNYTEKNLIYSLEPFYDLTADNLETYLFNKRYASIIKLLSNKKIEINDPDEPGKKKSNNAILNCFQINITLNSGKNEDDIIQLNTNNSFVVKYISFINKINTLNNSLFVLKPENINGNLVISNSYNPSYSGLNKYYGCHLLLEDNDGNKTLFNRFKLELIYNNLDEGKISKESLDGLKFIFEKNNNYRLYSKSNNSDLQKDEYYHEYIKEENSHSSININTSNSEFVLMDDSSNYNIISSLKKVFENIKETKSDSNSNRNILKYKQVKIKNTFEYIIKFIPDTITTDSQTMITYDNFNISNIDNYIDNTKTTFNYTTEVCDNDSGLTDYKLLYSFKQNDSNNNFTTKTTYRSTDIKTFTSMRIKDIDQIILDTMTQTILPVINFDEKIIKAEHELSQIKDIYKFNELSNQMTQMRFYRS
jgi:hypothetical protein